MNQQVLTVTPRNGKWFIEGADAQSEFEKQNDAIEAGRTLARNLWEKEKRESQLRVKGEDGKIRDESTYGNDPRKYES